jgi:hypothetical protein
MLDWRFGSPRLVTHVYEHDEVAAAGLRRAPLVRFQAAPGRSPGRISLVLVTAERISNQLGARRRELGGSTSRPRPNLVKFGHAGDHRAKDTLG